MSRLIPSPAVLDSENLKAFTTLPLFVQIIDYNPPVNNVWANDKLLHAQQLSLEDFCKQARKKRYSILLCPIAFVNHCAKIASQEHKKTRHLEQQRSSFPPLSVVKI